MDTETQQGIAAWADESFGPADSLARVIVRAQEELVELLREHTSDGPTDKQAVEAADTVIVLCRPGERLGTPDLVKIGPDREYVHHAGSPIEALLEAYVCLGRALSFAATHQMDNMDRAHARASVEEAAVMLHTFTFMLGLDLQAVINNKMAVNRAREWKRDGTGHGYHVKPTAQKPATVGAHEFARDLLGLYLEYRNKHGQDEAAAIASTLREVQDAEHPAVALGTWPPAQGDAARLYVLSVHPGVLHRRLIEAAGIPRYPEMARDGSTATEEFETLQRGWEKAYGRTVGNIASALNASILDARAIINDTDSGLAKHIALQKLENARKVVSDLCKPRGTPGARDWTMSIPARPDEDPDLVISDALETARVILLHALE